MNPLAPFLDNFGFAMLDGGISTELERHGADLDDPLWTSRVLLDAPERIRAMHQAFLENGADIIATTTYQASMAGFQRAGLSEDAARNTMREAIGIAVQTRNAFWSIPANRSGRLRPLVAVSLGPYGAALHDGSEYHGDYAADDATVRAFHRERIAALIDAGGDLFAFETIPSMAEAGILLELLPEFPDLKTWISFSCRDGRHVAHGEVFADCAHRVTGSRQVLAVGVNCTAPENIAPLLASASGVDRPLVAYPNSGETWDAAAQCWRGEACDAMDVGAWYRRGARLIGGCCRTGAEDIATMRRSLCEYLAK
ncbi:MAG: homocysteine S-methyltransferase [Woeseiaceae bacterium]